MKGDYKATM